VNERIKQLVEQAGILKEQSVQAKIVKNEDGTWTSILEYPDLEKFAELLIRQCIQAVKNVGGYNEDYHMNAIKKYFGVEE
jgi:hypothetical protein